MLIMVHLHTILQKPTDHGLVDRLQIELPDGSRLVDLIERLDIELSTEALLLAVNGRMADPERELKDGDQVNLMPAISGGSALELNENGERFQPALGNLESDRAYHHLCGGKERIG
jgi:sulfur carrier protein ThiS